jgi:hypothetical protein
MEKRGTKKILACPFCGGVPTVRFQRDAETDPGYFYYVTCSESTRCHATPIAFGRTKPDAIASWNKRQGGDQ